jgi:hypothetical protein
MPRQLRVQGDARGAERFTKASTHWMRHSHASHAIASGMPIETAQQTLGHASLATTTVYVTTEKCRRMKAFWKRKRKLPNGSVCVRYAAAPREIFPAEIDPSAASPPSKSLPRSRR